MSFNDLILYNASYDGIVTELLSYVPTNKENFVNNSFNGENMRWIVTHAPLQGRAFQDRVAEKMTKKASQGRTEAKSINRKEKKIKKAHKRKNKVKKCFLKLLKKKGKHKFGLHNKYMLPLILGLVVAKSMLIPLVLKALAFISAKGLMMGFFSTALASVLSLKGMFDHSHGYQHRRDDLKTQVEIIRLPTNKGELPYYDELYRRSDFGPIYKRTNFRS